MVCACLTHVILSRYDCHHLFKFTCRFGVRGIFSKCSLLMGYPIICMLCCFRWYFHVLIIFVFVRELGQGFVVTEPLQN